MKTEFNYKIAPKSDGLIGVLKSTSLAFAIVVRDVTARRELDTIKLAINVTWFFSFLIREGTWALQRPVAAFSKKQVWLIMRNQFAYLSWIVEDTNVSMYWSFRVTCASWRQSQRTGLPLPLSERCVSQALCAWMERLGLTIWNRLTGMSVYDTHQRSRKCCLGKCFCSVFWVTEG